MQPVTMVSAGCRAPRRVLFDARRFDALAFSKGFSFSRKRARACTLHPTYTNAHTDITRATVIVRASYVRGSHVRPSQTRAVKASQSSFHPCSLHGRTSRNMRRFERKSNPRKGQRTAWTHPAIYYILICALCTYIHITMYIHIKLNGKRYPRLFCNGFLVRSRESPRSMSSAWHVCLRLVTRHAA